MKSRATATFTIASWDETRYADLEGGGKLTRAVVKKRYSGEIEGEGTVEYLMAYRPDGSAQFVGMEKIDGRIGGRSGVVVLRHEGVFENGMVRSTWTVIPGEGAGDLAGMRGEVRFSAGHQPEYPVILDYEYGEDK